MSLFYHHNSLNDEYQNERVNEFIRQRDFYYKVLQLRTNHVYFNQFNLLLL